MADNKHSVHRGVNPGDEEQLRRLPAAPGAAEQPAAAQTMTVPRAATRPGRAHDQARAKDGVPRATRRAETPPHRDTTIRGNTYETNDATGHTSHKNR